MSNAPRRSREELNKEILRLARQLRVLQVQAHDISNDISDLVHERDEGPDVPRVLDSNGSRIREGQRVRYRTRGTNSSEEGRVTRVAANRVYTIDTEGLAVWRAPSNVTVIWSSILNNYASAWSNWDEPRRNHDAEPTGEQ